MQPPDSLLTGRPHLQQQPGIQARSTMIIECPKAMVGRVIGKNGETIKALQTYTGSLIQVNQIEDPCQITISGAPLSMNLALSMVSDIVKGSFKGFALLRQLAGSAGGTQQRQPPPAQLPQQQLPSTARPMYAPGYGLIPSSQLFGNEEESMMPADMGLSGSAAMHGVQSGMPLLSGHTQGMQQTGQAPRMYGPTGAALMNPQLPQFQQDYGAMPGGMPFGGMPYYQPLEVPGMNVQALDPMVYQGLSKPVYGTDDVTAGGANSQPQQQWACIPGLTSESGSSQQQQGTLFLSQLPPDNRMPQRHSGVACQTSRQDERGAVAQQHYLPVGEGSAAAFSGTRSSTTKLMQAALGGTGVASGVGWISDNKRYGPSTMVSELVDPGSFGKLSPVMPGRIGGSSGSPLVMMGQDGKLFYINHE